LKQIIAKILNILNRKERVKLYTHILLDLVIGLLDIAFLGLLLVVINFYTATGDSGKFLLFQSLFSKKSLLLISLFLILFGLKNWLGYLISKSENTFFYDVASRLSRRNILHYLKDSYIKFINIDSSVYIRKISQQPIEFSNYILINVQQVIAQSILIFFTIVGILFYHPVIFLSLFILLVPPVVLLAFFIRNKLKQVRASSKRTSQMALQYLKESLAGFVESNVYDKNEFFGGRYYQYQQQLNENIATQQTLQGLPPRLIEVFAVLGFLILIALNKWSANVQHVSLLDIGVFMTASYKIIPGMVKILNSTGQIKTYEFTLNDLLLPDEHIINNHISPSKKSIRSIKFENACFKFKESPVIDNLCFEIRPGDFVGVSGRSGLGKTTIVNLILGFLEQENGNIIINDKTTNTVERQLYLQNISYVKQQPFLINDSIRRNITLTDEGYDADKLMETMTFCGIESMFDQNDDGIDKLITENGKNISGGQRQRLALARALYHDFDLLILDEPFSEIDERAENVLLGNIKSLAKTGKMILMITHNKASLSFCNKIISLDGE